MNAAPGCSATCGNPAAGLAMPTRAEDYEVLYTIGTGSYGRCQKIRRKSDGKVSAGPFPGSALAAVSPALAGAPSAAEGRREVWAVGLGGRVPRRLGRLPPVCACPGSLEAWETASFDLFFFCLSLVYFRPFSGFDLLKAFSW